MVTYIFDKLKNGNKINVINQLKVALNAVKIHGVEPDLRIHSKRDNIIKPPKEPYLATPGDHFAIFTHPGAIRIAINDFISSVNNKFGWCYNQPMFKINDQLACNKFYPVFTC